jgi:hypothetical protein
LTDGNPASFNGVGVLDAKQLHCDHGPSDDTIWLLNADNGTVLDTLVIHVTAIPEPMTIMLLGLGGLMLRKRRAL